MQEKLTEIFKKARHETTAGMPEEIWHSIVLRNKKIAKIKAWVFSVAGLGSLAGLIPAVQILAEDLSRSGFYDYSSLIFSNGVSMLSYWKEFALSLAESFPAASIILPLFLVFVLFLSLRFGIKQFIKIQSLSYPTLSTI